MLDARELADIRADYADVFFGQSITRKREGTTPDEGGGELPVMLPDVLYMGRVVNSRHDRFHKEGEQQRALARLQIQLPWNADVKPKDILQVADGSSYTVIGTNADQSERQCLTADVT